MTIRKGMAVGKGSGYKNIIPKYDARVHSQAAYEFTADGKLH